MRKIFNVIIRAVVTYENGEKKEMFLPCENLADEVNYCDFLINERHVNPMDIKFIHKTWTVEGPRNRAKAVYIHRKSLSLISKEEYDPARDASEFIYIA